MCKKLIVAALIASTCIAYNASDNAHVTTNSNKTISKQERIAQALQKEFGTSSLGLSKEEEEAIATALKNHDEQEYEKVKNTYADRILNELKNKSMGIK